jgi:RimJ/RimL family protein N-acetyltransferase
MSAAPKTVLQATAAEAEAIRRAVREVDPATLGLGRVRADLSHVAGLVALLSDPAVSGPIYDLPRPIDEDSITRWVAEAQAQALAGEGLLLVTLDAHGEVTGYSKFTIWPEHASGELAGAIRADAQNQGQGGSGAAHTFGWMFNTLGLRLIGLTAALDNVRSAKLIEAAGFKPMGEREVPLPGGGVRRSLYWEMTRDEWRARHRL